MLKLCHNLFEKFRDENKFEELEIVTGAPYLAFARENLLTVSNQIRELFEEKLVKITAQTLSGQMQNLIFFTRTCCSAHKTFDKPEPGLFEEENRCTEKLCLCSKTYYCYDKKSDKFKFSRKVLIK